jgi:hypothetical protein
MSMHLYLRNASSACLLSTRALELGTILESCILMLCSALTLCSILVFVAAYLEIPDPHRHVDTNGGSFPH